MSNTPTPPPIRASDQAGAAPPAGLALARPRLHRVAPGVDAQTLAAAVELSVSDAAASASVVAVLKRGRDGSVVYAAGPSDRAGEIVVKARPLPGPIDRLRARLGIGRADRQARGARFAREAGASAAEVLAVGSATSTAPDGRRGVVELVITRRVPGRTLLEWLALSGEPDGLTPREEHALAREAGRQLARLALAGLVDRDHKPSNLVSARTPPISLIDPVGVRHTRDRHAAVVRMLASLFTEPFGCGVAPRRTLCARVLVETVHTAWPGSDDETQRRRVRELAHDTHRLVPSEQAVAAPKDDPLAALRRERAGS